MFTINLTQRFAERDIGVLRDFIGGQHVWCVRSVHGPAMLRTAGPERMRHLEQVQANQDHLPELSWCGAVPLDPRRALPRQRRRGPLVLPQPSMLTAEATGTSFSIR